MVLQRPRFHSLVLPWTHPCKCYHCYKTLSHFLAANHSSNPLHSARKLFVRRIERVTKKSKNDWNEVPQLPFCKSFDQWPRYSSPSKYINCRSLPYNVPFCQDIFPHPCRTGLLASFATFPNVLFSLFWSKLNCFSILLRATLPCKKRF